MTDVEFDSLSPLACCPLLGLGGGGAAAAPLRVVGAAQLNGVHFLDNLIPSEAHKCIARAALGATLQLELAHELPDADFFAFVRDTGSRV